MVKEFEDDLPSAPSAVACFLDDLEACVAHLRIIIHRRAIPPSEPQTFLNAFGAMILAGLA